MNKKPLLNEPRTWRGYWWPPGERDKAIPGILAYRPDKGLVLELIGGWEADIMEEVAPGVTIPQGSRRWPVLHGLSDNQELTLLDCLPTNTRGRIFGPPEEQTIHVLTALSGVHLNAADQAVFTECQVAVEDLTMWSNSWVLSQSFGMEEGRPNGKGCISAEPAKDRSVTVNGVVTSLVHEHTLPYFEYTRGGTLGRMTETRFFRFQAPEPWSLATAQEHAKVAQDLLSLALNRPRGLLWMQLKMPPEDRVYPEGYPVQDRKVDLYAEHITPAEPSAKALQDHQALFTCKHLPFEEIWPRWWEVRERYLRASNMILSLGYAPARFIEGRLLTATGAAEVLHRALGRRPPPIPKDEFAALRKVLLANTPNQHQKWVREKLRNEVTLKERLLELAALPDPEAMQRLVPNVEHWVTVTTQARNDLTHEGHARRQSIDEVIAAVKVTSAVVVMNLLQALGVPSTRQREIITENPELRQTARQASEDLSPRPIGEESTEMGGP
ncbi:HEPN domain-containing protein [Pseudarthrobacter sp. C4D7]|uniref:ApeA N-terminal domain 1-containing protein n=1 Tax=Pseudarthrobacter sp. C4D7 TaxID=2735268 RepID=UPI0015853FE0|nr:HEPN domain-containing protein [Pseudarthrobacter sp. C4D7]NUT73343.1 hypothetical protein [Pseudarthrobacter sp. C4D7]